MPFKATEYFLLRLRAAAKLREQFDVEVQKFQEWSVETNGQLDKLFVSAGDAKQRRHFAERAKDLTDDVVTHRADVSLINDLGRQIQDEVKVFEIEILESI